MRLALCLMLLVRRGQKVSHALKYSTLTLFRRMDEAKRGN